MKKKTAILFGATGLIGGHVLKMLQLDDRYSKIVVFTRSDPETKYDKAEYIKTGLDDLDIYEDKLKGDEVFCCLGTTMKKAGSKEQFRKVDFGYPKKIAEIAEKNKIPGFLVISSIGADAESSNFYLRTKGELEKYLFSLNFRYLVVLRPSLLLGKRSESRLMEDAGKAAASILRPFFLGSLKKYRAIEAEHVAKAMLKFANNIAGRKIFESHQIELSIKE
jgi:uncharacterized protein YbjT (DUF2867 family)